MIYKLINEDNTLVKDYPAPEIYKTLSDEEKNNIFTIKNEIEKITLEKGLGKVYVNVMYDFNRLEKEFIIKYSNEYDYEYYKNLIQTIYQHLSSFTKRNDIYDFFHECHILLDKN